MLSRLIRMRWPIPVLVVVIIVALAAGTLAATGGGSDSALVIYNGRSHYGTEQVFLDFEEETGIEVELRGGTAPELFERLRREGEDTPADLLVTTDLANLWRAEEARLLQPSESSTLEANIPDGLRDPEGYWWALTTRMRIPVVSTERVEEGAVDSYDDLGDPAFRGRTCLRTSTSEYNQSLVADMIAKQGHDETEAELRSWMDNDPEIFNSDGELLAAMAAGGCDVGLVNHYYLGRAIQENDGDFPVTPAWPDQDGAGAHTNVSGVGIVTWSDQPDEALQLIEYLSTAEAQATFTDRSEFAANPEVPPADHLSDWDGIVLDPIDVEEAGPLLDEAVELMLEVGWN
ncbi:MAG: extracellular solute-binding protein [Acidimicrobiales bacterium]|nr:extracellular solute-binding protein [Acidimicrobiales bacterium]